VPGRADGWVEMVNPPVDSFRALPSRPGHIQPALRHLLHLSSLLLVTSCSQADCSEFGWSRLYSSCQVSASSWRRTARLRSACPYAMALSPFVYLEPVAALRCVFDHR
jgi:hypothetical protein